MTSILRSGLVAACFCLLMGGQAQAQLSDKLMPHFGFMFEQLRLSSTQTQGSIANSFYLLHGGAYYMLGQSRDIFSYGIQPNVHIGVSPILADDGLRLGYMVQVPVYFMARVGANSTPYNQQRLGLALGAGASVTAIRQYYPDLFSDRGTFITPEVAAELTINMRGNPMIIRGHLSVLGSNVNVGLVDRDGNDVSRNFELDNAVFFGVGIVYPINL